MKATLLLLAAFGQSGRLIDVPAPSAPQFPMLLHVITTRAGLDTIPGRRRVSPLSPLYLTNYGPSGMMHGYGTANLTGDPSLTGAKGIEFSFDCGNAFAAGGKNDLAYPARWSKAGQQLEILTQRAGTSRTDTCAVAVQLKPRPYDVAAKSLWHSALLGGSSTWRDPDVAYTGDAPEYTVHLRVLDSHFRVTPAGVYGYGTANLLGPSQKGANFTYTCDRGLTANSQPGEFYLAHWIKQDQKLEMLQQRIGSNHVDRCRISLTLQPAPFPDPS